MKCGLPDASSVTTIEPVRVPKVVGVKLTLRVQEAPGASVAGQSLVCAKSGPLTATPATCRSANPELVSVAVCAALVVPISRAGKARLEGVSETAGAGV